MNFFGKPVPTFSRIPAGTLLTVLAAACMVAAWLQAPSTWILLPVLALGLQKQRFQRLRAADKLLLRQEMARLHRSTVECLASAQDAKDQNTRGHIRRVQVYALEMGRRAQLSPTELDGLKAAALLHDIGKLAIPESILNKPNKLSQAEFERIKQHPVVGADILSQMEFPGPVLSAIRHHHERFDGNGYPDGLRGSSIPVTARILAIADFYDALRSNRPYRHALRREEVVEIIRREKGVMFDPELADLFCQQVAPAEEALLNTLAPEARAQDLLFQEYAADIPGGAGTVVEHLSPEAADCDSLHEAVFAIHELAGNLGAGLDLEDILAIAANKALRLVPATTCVIYLLDPHRNRMEARHVSGKNVDRIAGIQLRRDQGVTGWSLTSRRLIANSDPAFDLAEVLPALAETYKSMTSVPLIENDQSFGAMTFYSEGADAHSSEHLRRLEIIMVPMARALFSGLIKEQNRKEFLTDPITGLPNRRSLELHGQEAIGHSQRRGGDASVLVMDLDRFGAFNSNFGSHIGDQLLREIGAVLRGCLRPADLLAHTENDTFVAVLNGISPDRAAAVVAQIQASVAAHSLLIPGGETLQLGISIGLACMPEDGHRLSDLLQAAESRLSLAAPAAVAAAAPVIPLNSRLRIM